MDTATFRRPRYERADLPPAMWFQERDGRILSAVYEHDGVLARRHLKAMFWPGATWRAMEMRLSLLYHQGYLDWPDEAQRRTRPIPEAICWLGWKGILWIAGQRGVDVEVPRAASEAQLRRLDRRLREGGIRWLREPRWSQLEHDLAVVDVRLAVEQSVRALPALRLETWVPAGEFLSTTDVVEYREPGQGLKKRGVRPDGYFVLVDERRRGQGLPARARFLLELDMATHDLGSFFREKVLAGLAYLQSPSYRARFGDSSGRWLVVTVGRARMSHLLRETGRVIGAGVFLFSTLDQVAAGNVLTSPIWWQVAKGRPEALLLAE